MNLFNFLIYSNIIQIQFSNVTENLLNTNQNIFRELEPSNEDNYLYNNPKLSSGGNK